MGFTIYIYMFIKLAITCDTVKDTLSTGHLGPASLRKTRKTRQLRLSWWIQNSKLYRWYEAPNLSSHNGKSLIKCNWFNCHIKFYLMHLNKESCHLCYNQN